MTQAGDKQQFLELPLAQRTIAVALKYVFDQIREIEQQEGKEIQKVHQSFMGAFKEVQTKASRIIKGATITVKDLENKQKYFSKDELSKVEGLIKANKGIQAYWLTVFLNYFHEDLSPADKQIATSILDIATNVTEERLELVFEIANNPWLGAGKYVKAFILKDGSPSKIEGTQVKWLKKRPEGTLATILRDDLNPEQILNIFPTVGEIINEVVPYSLQYFLGAVEDIEEQEEQEQQDQEQYQEDQEDETSNKKVKQ